VQAMTMLYSAWASAPIPPPAIRFLPPRELPRTCGCERWIGILRPSKSVFSLGRLSALTPCELEVARWANAGHSNAAIASLRQTSIHTVARQIASVYSKLGVGARVGLATIAELYAWSPPGLGLPESEAERMSSWPSADGVEIDPFGRGADLGRARFGLLEARRLGRYRRDESRSRAPRLREGRRLDTPQRAAARRRRAVGPRLPQKVVAIRLGLAPSTVSSVLASAKRRFGFASLSQLVRAYGGSWGTDDTLARMWIEGRSSCNQE